jgi:hypothetical protein
MWRSNEPTREEISNVPGMDPQSKRRRSRRRAWRDELADQTVVTTLEHALSYRAFERAVVGSIDPRSVMHSLIGWQACCGDFVVPVQLKPACSSFKTSFCSRTGRIRPVDLINRRCS